MIDYGPFKLVYKYVHVVRIYQFEHFLIKNRLNDRIGYRLKVNKTWFSRVEDALGVVQMV